MITHDCHSWIELLERVYDAVQDFQQRWESSSAVPFFRGHAKTEYKLVPGLFRHLPDGREWTRYDEPNIYYEFLARAGSLLRPDLSTWDIIFLMQHHGVPTRLLDWTESFSSALYFALHNSTGEVHIWMLDPYGLNHQTWNPDRAVDKRDIINVDLNLNADYFDYFIRGNKKPEWVKAIAVFPRRQNPRLASQSGVFTLHAERTPLEEAAASYLTRFTLRADAVTGARQILKVLGVNDYSMYPDLDGLARLLRDRFPPGR